MFACAITANVCYGLGILIRAYSWDVIYSSAPWILGSLGTVSLDIVIFAQVSHHTLSRTVCAEQTVALHLCWRLVTVCYSASKLVGLQPASLLHSSVAGTLGSNHFVYAVKDRDKRTVNTMTI